jgi:hypothetical protein
LYCPLLSCTYSSTSLLLALSSPMMVSSMMHTRSPNTLNTQSRCMRSYSTTQQNTAQRQPVQ